MIKPLNYMSNFLLKLVILTVSCINMIHAQAVNTANGWIWVSPYPYGGDFNTIEVVSSSVILAGGNYGTVMRSSDGGTSWQQTDTPSGFTDPITHNEFFSNGLNGMAAAGGKLLVTSDCRQIWHLNNDIDSYSFQSYSS